MNKNDFYKEIMTSYALDPEKIRMNAIKQAKKPAWQKVASTYWKPAMGIAAAAAVTVGAVTFSNRPSAPDVIVAPEAALSASQRLIDAEKSYYNPGDEQHYANVYVTFMEPVSYTEILMAISAVDDSGDIELCSVYLEDRVIAGDEINAFAAEHADEDSAVAAKLSLPAGFYRDIQDLSIVYLAELGSAEINDDTFVPIEVDDDDPLENDHLSIVPPVTSAPVVTTTPFSFEEIPVTTPEEVPVIGESSEDSAVVPPVSEEEDEVVEEPAVTTTTVVAPETTPEETTTTYYRGDVGLLTEMYELNVENALNTYVAGNNVVVLTKNQAYLYTIGGFGSQYGDVVDIINPKLAFRSEDRIILTGCNAENKRNIIISVNAETDNYIVYDASANIGENEIASISYCESADKFYLKAVSQNSSLVYELNLLSDSEFSFRPLVEVQAPISIAGSSGDVLYFATTAGTDRTTLYSFNCLDGTLLEYADFSGVAKIKRGADFRSFAILVSDGTSFIFDVETVRLVSAQVSDDVQITAMDGETFFTANGATYKLNVAGEICEADRPVAFGNEERPLYIVNEINSDKVVIIRDDGNNNIW